MANPFFINWSPRSYFPGNIVLWRIVPVACSLKMQFVALIYRDPFVWFVWLWWAVPLDNVVLLARDDWSPSDGKWRTFIDTFNVATQERIEIYAHESGILKARASQ